MAKIFNRPVKVAITGDNITLDAYKSVYKRVEELEKDYYNSSDDSGVNNKLKDITDTKVIFTGGTPYRVHVFKADIVFASADYKFAFIESAPDIESVSPDPTPPDPEPST